MTATFINDFETAFNAYKAASKAADDAEQAYIHNSDNEEIEAAFDEAYQRQHDAYMAAANILADGIGVSVAHARKMISSKGEELLNLLARTA